MDHLDIAKNIGSSAARKFITETGGIQSEEFATEETPEKAETEIGEHAEKAQQIMKDAEPEAETEDPSEEMDDNTNYEALISLLKKLFDANFAFQFKVHSLHWNLIDPDYIEYHAFYDGVYQAANDVVDTYAEWLRRLDAPAPIAVNAGLPGVVSDLRQGLAIVLADAEAFIQILRDALEIASDLNEQGLVNFLADQQDVHQKLRWFIKSILGK